MIPLTILFFSEQALFAYGSPQDQEPGYRHYRDTQKKVTVDAYVIRMREDALKIEFISDPPGKVQLKSAQFISPEGVVCRPKEMYEVSEQAARHLGRLRPIPVPKEKKTKSKKVKIGSLLLGTGLTALSGFSGSSGTGAAKAAECATDVASKGSSGLSALGAVGGLVPLALSQAGNSGQTSSEEVEWVEPQTAGTGLFSNVAEFSCPPSTSSSKPWRLEAEMEQQGKSVSTYTFYLQPDPFISGGGRSGPPSTPSDWEMIQLTGSKAKLL